jgi:hypothetical protein
MAGACKANGVGRVITVDTAQLDDRSDASDVARELWARCGVQDRVEMVRMPYSTYSYWLMEQVERQRDADGRCQPLFDFVYLDGAKSLIIDGSAVALIAPLLTQGGWLLMDDLSWSFADHPDLRQHLVYDNGVTYEMSDIEFTRPHLRSVFDCIVTQHPAFGRFEVWNEWGWAQKTTADHRTMTITHSVAPARPLVDRVRSFGRRTAGRLRGG